MSQPEVVIDHGIVCQPGADQPELEELAPYVAVAQQAHVVAAIQAHRFTYRDEDQLQEGLAAALAGTGLPVRREVRLGARDRLDLLVDRVAVEVKVAGTAETALRQLARYASHDQVGALVLVTTKARHATLPDQVGGKPLQVVVLGGVG